MEVAAELGLPRRSDPRSSIDDHPCIHIPRVARLCAPTLLGLQGSVKNKTANGATLSGSAARGNYVVDYGEIRIDLRGLPETYCRRFLRFLLRGLAYVAACLVHALRRCHIPLGAGPGRRGSAR
jgi:hypothetical protein